MDGLCRAIGAPAHHRYKGRVVTIRLTLAMLGEIENWMIQSKPSPYALISQLEVTADMTELADRCAVQLQPTFADLDKFLKTREGASVALWINVRDSGESYERVRDEVEAYDDEQLDSLRQSLYMAGGIDRYARLDWPVADMEGGESGKPSIIRWRLMMREAFEANGSTPDMFGDLTIYQFRTITSDKSSLGGGGKINKAKWFAMTPEQRRQFIKNRKSKRELYGSEKESEVPD